MSSCFQLDQSGLGISPEAFFKNTSYHRKVGDPLRYEMRLFPFCALFFVKTSLEGGSLGFMCHIELKS